MPKVITISEALAELKVIQKRIESKEKNVLDYALRHESTRDPIPQSEGGSVSYVTRELQSIKALRQNQINIRRAIQRANEETFINLEGINRSIAEWLIWRRDISNSEINFLKRLSDGIGNARMKMQQQGNKLVTDEAQAQKNDLIVNLSETELRESLEQTQLILDRLDGQLSMRNATVTVEIDD